MPRSLHVRLDTDDGKFVRTPGAGKQPGTTQKYGPVSFPSSRLDSDRNFGAIGLGYVDFRQFPARFVPKTQKSCLEHHLLVVPNHPHVLVFTHHIMWWCPTSHMRWCNHPGPLGGQTNLPSPVWQFLVCRCFQTTPRKSKETPWLSVMHEHP